MKQKQLYFLFLYFISFLGSAQTTIQDSETKEPVAFATISFGNGNGIFADDEGKFFFTKKLYSDIDTLYISALGFKDLKMPTKDLPKIINLESFFDELQEVIVKNKPKGKFKIEKLKSTTHDDYYKCWLPTIESEIAVFFPNTNEKTKRLTTVHLPIKTEAKAWRKRNHKKVKKKQFSTLFRVQFYENNNGLPGDVLTYEKIMFIAKEDTDKVYELDISKYDIYVPKNGVFVSIQVLGYTDKKGKLLPNKKYQEVKTKRGIVKVSTTFRPLLPFTSEIAEKRTFVKRIFLNGGEWQLFDKKNVSNSTLLNNGLNNYGMGLKMEVYKNE